MAAVEEAEATYMEVVAVAQVDIVHLLPVNLLEVGLQQKLL